MKVLAAALALVSGAAAAVSPDLKISSDDLNEAGEHFLELQASKASRPGPHAADPRVPFQFLGEYSYGITDSWQVAVKLPFAREEGARGLGGGAELRYLGPHDRAKGGYWGVDLSAARERERPGDAPGSTVEIQPVFGYRTRAWHFSANVPIGFPASGPDRSATLGFQSKAGRRLGAQEVGLEFFRHADRTRHLFLAWDKVYGNELNVALGRGLTEASERWILKLAYSFPLQ